MADRKFEDVQSLFELVVKFKDSDMIAAFDDINELAEELDTDLVTNALIEVNMK
jgi:hypothetical protein